MSDLYGDFVYTRLTADAAAADTTLAAEDVSLFPSNTVLAKGEFWLTIESPLSYPNTFEIVKLTSVDSDTNVLTVVRGQEGTSAADHGFGTYLKGALTSGMLRRVRAGLSGETVPTGLDSDLYQLGDTFYETSTSTSYIYDGTTGFVAEEGGGGGGGAPDPAMPQLSAPTLYEDGLTSGVAWDGKDVDGDVMPAGFLRAVLEVQDVVVGSYASDGSFDVSAETDTDPYTVSGFTNVLASVVNVGGGILQPETSSSSLPGGIIDGSWLSLECTGSSQEATFTFPNVSDVSAMYVLFGCDQSDGSDFTGTAAFFQGTGSVTWVQINSDNTYAIGSTATFDVPEDNIVTIGVSGTTGVIKDSSDTVLTTGGTGAVAATGVNFLFSPPSSGLVALVVKSAATSLGDWAEVAAFSGAGALLIPAPGACRLVAVNESQTAGIPSGTTTIAYEAKTVGFGSSNAVTLSDVVMSGPVDGDVLTYRNDLGLWWNAPPSSADIPTLQSVDDVQYGSGPNDGQVLTWNAGTSHWTNEDPAASTLADDTDVDFTTPPTDGQLLGYDDADSKWKPVDPPGVGGASLANPTWAPPIEVQQEPGTAVVRVSRQYDDGHGSDIVAQAGFDHYLIEMADLALTFGSVSSISIGAAGAWTPGTGWVVIGGGAISSDGTVLTCSSGGDLTGMIPSGSQSAAVAIDNPNSYTDMYIKIPAGVNHGIYLAGFGDVSSGTAAHYVALEIVAGSSEIIATPVVSGVAGLPQYLHSPLGTFPLSVDVNIGMFQGGAIMLNSSMVPIAYTLVPGAPGTGAGIGFILGSPGDDSFAIRAGSISAFHGAGMIQTTSIGYVEVATLKDGGGVVLSGTDTLTGHGDVVKVVRARAVGQDNGLGSVSPLRVIAPLGARGNSVIAGSAVSSLTSGTNSSNTAEALAANPAAYVEIIVAGTPYVIPVYNR